MDIKFKKLQENAIIPAYANEGDAGMDLVAANITYEASYIEYGTGLAVAIPKGYVGLLFPRSSISKKDLSLCNSVGVLDSGYRGQVKLRFKGSNLDVYQIGERIAQLVVVPIPQCNPVVVDELDVTERGDGGFGSSGV